MSKCEAFLTYDILIEDCILRHMMFVACDLYLMTL